MQLAPVNSADLYISNKTFYFLLDPILNIYGSSTPAILLGKKLIKNNRVYIVSPLISNEIEYELKNDFDIINLNRSYKNNGSLLTLEGWFKSNQFHDTNDDDVVINFSQSFISKANIYYAPGPMIFALDDIYPELPLYYKIIYNILRAFIKRRDIRFNNSLRAKSNKFIAVSNYAASLYNMMNINIEHVIHPPLDTNLFRSITNTPDNNFVLTYIGKETNFKVLNYIARQGVKIKAFGAKIPFMPSYILNNPNIELLGKISNERLVELYSNALYTLFPFTHEPFGYIPVESIACSTPVLTYNKQGPKESIIDNKNGWLADNDQELIDKAIDIWNNGYDQSIRRYCRESAMRFDINNIYKQWVKILTN